MHTEDLFPCSARILIALGDNRGLAAEIEGIGRASDCIRRSNNNKRANKPALPTAKRTARP